MVRPMRALPSCLLVVCVLFAPQAHADLVVTGTEVNQDRSTGRRGGESPRTVYLSPRGVRVDEEGRSHIMDADKKVMVELDHRTRTARVLTFAQLGKMTAQARQEADQAVAAARKQMEALPPELRPQVEAAIRAQRSAMEARQQGAYQRTPTGVRRTINGLACEEVKETLNGQWMGTSCVHKGVHLDKRDREMLLGLAKDMAGAGLSGGQEGEFTRAFLDGIPVEMAARDGRTGEMRVEERVTRIEKKRVPASLFEVPEGYRRLEWETPASEEHHDHAHSH